MNINLFKRKMIKYYKFNSLIFRYVKNYKGTGIILYLTVYTL